MLLSQPKTLDRGREYGMGIFKNLRAGAAFMREQQQAAMEMSPRWARVVRVGHQAFGMVSVDVEQHLRDMGLDGE
jgi:hypothetical protein